MRRSFKSLLASVLVVILTLSSLTAASAAPLSDLAGNPNREAIETLVDAGAVVGLPDGTFGGERTISRAEFATMLNRYFGFTDASGEQFSDVPADAWYAQDMLIAKTAGYMAGIGNNMGAPTAEISRQEAFVMIAGIYGLSVDPADLLEDVEGISPYAIPAVSALIKAGILTRSDLRPGAPITRNETAVLFVDAVDKQGKPEQSVQPEQPKPPSSSGGSSSSSSKLKLTSLDVIDITQKDIFDEATKTATVQSDIYGVLVKAESAAQLTVTAEKTTYDDEGELTYTAGEAIPYNEKLGGYIVPLSEAYEDYDSEYTQTVTITAASGSKAQDYTVTIKRECDKKIHDLFQKETYAYDMGEGGELAMNYLVYYPSNFDESKEYPVVLVLHGSGQMEYQPGYPSTDMIVKRNQAALAWAKDSEKGINECIVVAPQISYYMTPDTPMWGGGAMLMPFGLAAYDLLENEFIAKDYVDEDRVYVTGLSLGGVGTYAMIGSHPETFAGAIIACGATYEDWYGGYDYTALEPLSGSIYLTHAQGDPEVDFSFYQQSTAGMEAAGIEYETKVWSEQEIFYPHAHYAWTPTYADETIRNWLFDQVREDPALALNDLDVIDITQKDIFDEATKTATVQSDIYGVLVKAESAAELTVTAEKTTYDDEGACTYTAGEAIPYDETLGGYIVPLSQAYEDYDIEYTQTVTITAASGSKSKDYIVTINRECDKVYHDMFEQKTYAYDMGDAGVLDLSYNVYFPSDFDESKEYPVVLALHGSGQMEFAPGYSSLDMIVKRNQLALAWAKDSEQGINQCIVVAPQLSPYKVENEYMWGGGAYLQTFGLAAYDLLVNEFIAKDYVNEDQIYVVGLSLGGVGTYAMIGSHPETFAGAIIACGATYEDWYGYDYSVLEPLSGSIYLTHAQGDPEVDFEAYEQSVAGLNAAGIEFETKTWTEEEIFYPHAHYSWAPTFADESIRNWLFEQVR